MIWIFWLIFVIFWFPVGALSYRLIHFLGGIVIDLSKGFAKRETPKKVDDYYRIWGIILGYVTFMISIALLIFMFIIILVIWVIQFLNYLSTPKSKK